MSIRTVRVRLGASRHAGLDVHDRSALQEIIVRTCGKVYTRLRRTVSVIFEFIMDPIAIDMLVWTFKKRRIRELHRKLTDSNRFDLL